MQFFLTQGWLMTKKLLESGPLGPVGSTTLLVWVVRWPDAALIYSLLTTLTLNRT